MDNGQPEAIDRAVLKELRSLQEEGEPDLIVELSETFRAEAPTLSAAMRTAVTLGNADKLKQAAHSLKGSSAGVGAKPLSALSAEVETLGRNGSVTGAAEKIDQIEQEYARVIKTLASESGNQA
ncbi:MAG: Hpt domain-containing protein [Chloroflexi bacterium]|nr:Hpt domain-containing protein [Chloroflexota bacterium]